jgi:decaprenylphospho-beta-D-ribofuranose 2-oxidase
MWHNDDKYSPKVHYFGTHRHRRHEDKRGSEFKLTYCGAGIMQLSGWGQYPAIDACSIKPSSQAMLRAHLNTQQTASTIARGLGRSYGDSALAKHVIDTRYLDHLLAFNPTTGLLSCQAGISLAEILAVFVPQGWFLPVTPGTKFITLGGAIACDVHGKNHHLAGSFCHYVQSITLALTADRVLVCSREQHADLFFATCGGMGLTGIILQASFTLKAIRSAYVQQTLIKTANLHETLAQLEMHATSTYSVAWTDCLTRGKQLGRSLLLLGEHAEDNDFTLRPRKKITIPMSMPSSLLNYYTLALFNRLYYHYPRKTSQRVDYDRFFYPLDKLDAWYRFYGRRGFVQYQCVLPKPHASAALTDIFKRLHRDRYGSFLSVLKSLGASNDNLLSFPMPGYTLALDFKLTDGLLLWLAELDRIVLDHGGRLYLAKDSRMSESTFKQSYSRWQQFQQIRQRYGVSDSFASLQSTRLGL